MTKRLLLDTDVLVDFLRGYSKAVKYIKTHSEEAVISAIAVAELYAGVRDTERRQLDDFIALFNVLPISQEIAKTGGLYKQQFFKSHGIGLADAIIAATSVIHELELKTLNTRHYPMIKGLRAPYTKM